MDYVDVCGPPGSGKSTICDAFWGPHALGFEDRLPPASWAVFIDEMTRLFEVIKPHPTFDAAVRMNNRSIRKISAVVRKPGSWPYTQTALVQRGLGFGWRMVDLGIDLTELHRFFWVMPMPLGVALARCPANIVKQRNVARERVPATAHENRSHMVDLMQPALTVLTGCLHGRGVPFIEIDTTQPIDMARQQLVAFATERLREARANTEEDTEAEIAKIPPWWTGDPFAAGPVKVISRDLLTPRRFDLCVKWRYFRHLLHGNDPQSEKVYRWHVASRKSANAKIRLGTDSSKPEVDDYVSAAQSLLQSMQKNGFLKEHAFAIDPNGEILSGAHRLSCALALGIEHVWVERKTKLVWPPKWGLDWFRENGMADIGLSEQRLTVDYSKIERGTAAG
jgi:hypothetical protein